MRSKPPATAIYPWLRSNLGKRCLGVLTSQDAAALAAAVQIVELFCYTDQKVDAAKAFGLVVAQMQPQAQYLAYHGIAMVRDWSDRSALWLLAGLDLANVRGRCQFEPQPRSAQL